MQSYLSTRPRSFPSLFSGIEWQSVSPSLYSKSAHQLTTPSIRSRTIRNSTSARVSVPSLLQLAPPEPTQPLPGSTDPSFPSTLPTPPSWIWRTDLAGTQPFWEDWFVGLSSKFLNAKGGKLLLLAGTDRLDKELMIGQMQGLENSLPT